MSNHGTEGNCEGCDKHELPILPVKAKKLVKELNDWMLVDEARLLAKQFILKDFIEAMRFVNEVAKLADTDDHHPDITISYDVVTLELSTHSADGLTDKDFALARKIDKIAL